jgi:hypothetical protein
MLDDFACSLSLPALCLRDVVCQGAFTHNTILVGDGTVVVSFLWFIF